MVKFFSPIKYDLMEKNKRGLSTETPVKAGKYLKYATREIVLVVIGILISIKINYRNKKRQDRAIEEQNRPKLSTDGIS